MKLPEGTLDEINLKLLCQSIDLLKEKLLDVFTNNEQPPWRLPHGQLTAFGKHRLAGNQLLLGLHSDKKDWKSFVWDTKKNWECLDFKIKPNAFFVPQLSYEQFTTDDVCNLSQVSPTTKHSENIVETLKIKIENKSSWEDYEKHIEKEWNCIKTRYGDSPKYLYETDIIEMPLKNSFIGKEEYYESLGHEVAHWLSNKKEFGGSYARNEFVAEITSCLFLKTNNMPVSILPFHEYQVDSWITEIDSDWLKEAIREIEFLIRIMKSATALEKQI